MEYFTGELKAGGVNFKDDDLSVLTVTSGAPDSSALNHNSVRLLEEFSGADIKVHSLDGLSGLENEVAALVGVLILMVTVQVLMVIQERNQC
jgi:hypothetical protein